MPKLTRLLLILALFVPGLGQAQDGVFRSYADLREQLDPLMKQRKVGDVLVLFGGSEEMSQEELAALDRKVMSIYTRDFSNVAVVRRQELLNGWSQELLAFWSGNEYIYVYMLLHNREDAFVSVNFKFNTNIHELIANF